MGASEKHAAAFHPGDGPTARTAADVLRQHPAWSATTEPGYWITVCDGCGATITRSRESSDRDAALAQHQADMLAAAGLLATAEPIVVEVHHHDIEKHAEWFNEGYETAVAQGLADDPTLAGDWLAEHDREIAAHALRDAADGIQALHPGETKASVVWLRARADEVSGGAA